MDIEASSLVLFTIVCCAFMTNGAKLVAYNDIVQGRVDENLHEISVPYWFHGKEIEDICIPDAFYPADPLEMIENVTYKQDCTVICHMEKPCLTSTYLFNLKQCFLSSVSPDFLTTDILSELNTEYCTVFGVHEQKELKRPTMLDHGRPMSQMCGRPHFFFNGEQRQKRIIGGQQGNFYSVPWIVHIGKVSGKYEKQRGFFCGGSLISSDPSASSTRFVLTAAHCIISPYFELDELRATFQERKDDIRVVAGTYDVRFTEAHEQTSQVHKIFLHKKFGQQGFLSNDLSILVLDQSISFNNYVNHICLQTKLQKIDSNSEQCFIAGWGAVDIEKSKLKQKKFEPTLKIAVVEVLKEKRRKILIAAKTSSAFPGTMCSGDSGGPMFCTIDNGQSFTLTGIASGFKKEGKLFQKKMWKNDYTRVSFFHDWILYGINNTASIANDEQYMVL